MQIFKFIPAKAGILSQLAKTEEGERKTKAVSLLNEKNWILAAEFPLYLQKNERASNTSLKTKDERSKKESP